MGFWNQLVGDDNAAALRRAEPIVAQVNALEPQFKLLSDEQLRDKTAEFKARLATRSKAERRKKRRLTSSLPKHLLRCAKRAYARSASGISMCSSSAA